MNVYPDELPDIPLHTNATYVQLAIASGLFGWVAGVMARAMLTAVETTIDAITGYDEWSAFGGMISVGEAIGEAIPQMLVVGCFMALVIVVIRVAIPKLYRNRGGTMFMCALIGAIAVRLVHYGLGGTFTFGNGLNNAYGFPDHFLLPSLAAGATLGIIVAAGDRIARRRVDPDEDELPIDGSMDDYYFV